MGAASSTVSCADRISLAKLYALTTKYRSDWPQLNGITNRLHDLGVPKDAFVQPFAQFPDLQQPFIDLQNFCALVDNKLAQLADKLTDPSAGLCLGVMDMADRRRVRDLFASNPTLFQNEMQSVKNAIMNPVDNEAMTLQQWVILVDEQRRALCTKLLGLATTAAPGELAAQISPLEPKQLPCSPEINMYISKLEDTLASRGANTLSQDEKLVLDLVKQYRLNQTPADVCDKVATLKDVVGPIDEVQQIASECASQLDDCMQEALDQGERNIAILDEKHACERDNAVLKQKLEKLEQVLDAYRTGGAAMV